MVDKFLSHHPSINLTSPSIKKENKKRLTIIVEIEIIKLNMKLRQFKRWNVKQKKYNQKYKLRSFKKSTSQRDHSGNYMFLISRKNLCTILKFTNKTSCVTEAALIVDDFFTKIMSKRILITTKHNKKLLKKCKVMVTKDYKEDIMQIVKITESSQKKPLKKITPIKILSCKFCNEKFTNLTTLDRHYETIHKLESETDSDEILEREINDILEDPDIVPIEPQIVINENDMVG